MKNEIPEIHGSCVPEFSAVKDAFAENLASGMEIGCSVAVTQGEDYAVDLWAGHRDEARSLPWEQDTVAMVASSTKIPTALSGLMLIDQGLIAPDDPVAKHWPEFAQNGKEDVLFRHFMTHSAGLPAPWPPIPFSTFFDWHATAEHLAAQAPWWPSGTEFGYHAETFGFLIGEIVRRLTGQTPGVYLKEHVFSKIGADFQIGFPKSEFDRMATMTPLDLAPDIGALPATPRHPERIIGKWYGESEIMGKPALNCIDISADDGELSVLLIRTFGGSEFRPKVEDVRFDGECLRLRASNPAGLLCWDCRLSGNDVMEGTLYTGGQESGITFTRGEKPELNDAPANDLSARAQQAVLPPHWKGSQSLTSELPSSNGMGNARSLARIGAVMANGGCLAGHTFLSPETIELALTEQIYKEGVVMNFGAVRFGLGFGLNSKEFSCPSDRSLHWGGAGGSVCVMDLESKTSLAYVMNGMLAGSKMDPRNQRLRAAYHKALGRPVRFDLAE